MATFGTLPGVKVTTTGGVVSGITIGRAQYLVLVGHGDPSGTASSNTAYKIDSRSDVDNTFGDGSDLARAYRDSIANGANRNFIYGVQADTSSVTESFSTVASGTLANTPIVDELDRVDATDTTDGVTATVNFVYEDAPATPSDADTINLNPINGEWVADSSSSYDITYSYSDWGGGLTGAEDVIGENEFGLICPLSNAESVASSLSTSLGNLRDQYKMAVGLMAAEPNATTTDYKPKYDTSTYSDNVDDDALFLVAPDTVDNADLSALGSIAGVFAGNDVSNPVYNDALTGTADLDQRLSKAEADDLRAEQVIPLRDLGSVRIRDNASTSTATDWERDFFRRRIVDIAVVTAKTIGEEILGFINDEDTRSNTKTLIEAELLELVDDGLLQPNTAQETNLFVDVFKIDSDSVGIDLGISPYGVVKRVDVDITINT